MCRRTKLIQLMLLLAVLCPAAQARPLNGHTPTDSYPGWRLGVQAYSFNRFSFYEAVEKNTSLGLTWMEAYPGQRLSQDHANAQLHHSMSAELRSQVKAKLAQHNIRLQAYGVVPGNYLRIRQHRPVTVVQVDHTELAFESDLANAIFMEML